MKLNGSSLLIAASVFTLSACETSPGIVAVDRETPAFTVDLNQIQLQQVVACKEGPVGSYSFNVSAGSNTSLPAGSPFMLNVPGGADVPNCRIVATSGGGGSATITEIENPAAPLVKVDVYHLQAGATPPVSLTTYYAPVAPIVLSPIGNDHGWLVVFTNDTGCTLTLGYWKTHNESFAGGAPVDPRWSNIGINKEQTPFFFSGMSWFGVFWTAPAGNAYYILAHQYMAAKLNILAGAGSTTAVNDAIASAETLFGNPAYSPAYVGALSGSSSLRKQYVALAGVLGAYNEGVAASGPDHCPS